MIWKDQTGYGFSDVRNFRKIGGFSFKYYSLIQFGGIGYENIGGFFSLRLWFYMNSIGNWTFTMTSFSFSFENFKTNQCIWPQNEPIPTLVKRKKRVTYHNLDTTVVQLFCQLWMEVYKYGFNNWTLFILCWQVFIFKFVCALMATLAFISFIGLHSCWVFHCNNWL